MNSLANLNSVVDVQGDSTSWPSDQGWDQPVATVCTGSSDLTDSRLQFHLSGAHATPRQEWDWSDSHMFLAPQYSAEDQDNLDSKPSILQVEGVLSGGAAGAGGSGGGLRPYGAGILSAASMNPSIGGGAPPAQSTWPELMNAVPLRAPHMGLAGSSTYSSPSMLYGGEGMGLAGGAGSGTGLGSYYTHQSPVLGLATDHQRLHDILKRGMYSAGADGSSPDFTTGRLGLNLGGRTYFSANDSNMLARFHVAGKRFRPNSPSLHVPLCQAEGCTSDLSMAKHYHRRHKVCEYHSKASTVIITGNTQRFCQQCSRFHALTEFDEGKRSCRKRLADHNRRRRKPQPSPSVIPSSNPGTSSELRPATDTNNAAPERNEEQDTKGGDAASHAMRSQSEQQAAGGVAKVEATAAIASSTELAAKPSDPKTSTNFAPSVSLTLQNAGSSREAARQQGNPYSLQVSSEEISTHEARDPGYGVAGSGAQAAPFLVNGPSLSLSSNVISPGAGPAPGIPIACDSVPPSHHPSSPHANSHAFNEVELSVPWLRPHHAGSSSRINLVQNTLGKLAMAPTHPQPEDGSLGYNSRSRDMKNTQFISEHRRLFADHLPAAAGGDHHHHHHHHHHHQHHHQALKTENWMLESAVAAQDQDQIVLSLLETSGSKKEQSYNDHQSAFNAHEQAAAGHGDQRHPLGFLQQQQQPGAAGGLHLSSASPSEQMDHEASDAALSLHCMQVLRPLNESLYTTADFMKDGFV